MDNKETIFKIPEFEYFQMGGRYSGCKRGTKQDDFNFRIIPSEKLKAETWYGIMCYEKSIPAMAAELELTREGYLKAREWIEEQYGEWLKEHKLRSPQLGYFCNIDENVTQY